MVYNRKVAQEQNKSKLDQLLSELIEEETLRSGVLEALLEAGVKTKEVQLMETEASFSKGLEKAQLEASQKYESQIEELRSKIEDVSATRPDQAKPDQTGLNPTDLLYAKFQKQIDEMSKPIAKTTEQNQLLLKQHQTERVNGRIKEIISSTGLEEPDTILALMRQKADFVLEPNTGEIFVTRAEDPTMPFEGPMTATSAEDFIKEFASTQTGSRFRSVPRDVVEPTGITGVNRNYPDRQTLGVPSKEDYERHGKALGIL